VSQASARTTGLATRGFQAIRNLRDRQRHSARHAAAVRKVQQIGMPKTILVVCAGNLCRSPYLQSVLRRDLPGVHVESAGFFGSERRAPAHALAVSQEKGFDLTAFRSSTVQPRAAREADLVLTMDQNQARYLATYMGVPRGRIVLAGDLDPEPSTTRAIQDPWEQSIDVFEAVFRRLDRCARTLTCALRAVERKPPLATNPPTSPVRTGVLGAQPVP
jgi:protein-tyrosine phosphatase